MSDTGKTFSILFLSALIGLGSFWYLDDLKNFFNDSLHKLPSSNDLSHLTELVKKEVFTPPPLELPHAAEVEGAVLTADGVVKWTNIERNKQGLGILSVDEQLTEAARQKIEDMFRDQYFEHVAPDGLDATTIVAGTGYEYLLVGENLALGNYDDDETLVTAWMNSPGHRENILREKYSEIGVAVANGQYQGKRVWMAVQMFARPQSDCPLPNDALRIQIEENEQVLQADLAELEEREREIEYYEPKNDSKYMQMVNEYNALAGQYNELIQKTKTLVSQYNTQVNQYNQCVE